MEGEEGKADGGRTTRGAFVELLFASDQERGDNPVFVFQHQPKTGGSALRSLIWENYRGAGLDRLDQEWKKPAPLLMERYRDHYRALPEERRDALVGVIGHTASLLIDTIDGPTQGITILRSPVERVLSRFYFGHARELEVLVTRMKRGAEQKASACVADGLLFNEQARALLAPRYDISGLTHSEGPPPDAEVWLSRLRDIIDEQYMVGVQEEYAETIATFADRFSWDKVFMPSVKVNSGRPRGEEVDAEIRDLIGACNWLDAEIHREHLERIRASKVRLADRYGLSDNSLLTGKRETPLYVRAEKAIEAAERAGMSAPEPDFEIMLRKAQALARLEVGVALREQEKRPRWLGPGIAAAGGVRGGGQDARPDPAKTKTKKKTLSYREGSQLEVTRAQKALGVSAPDSAVEAFHRARAQALTTLDWADAARALSRAATYRP